MKVLNNLLVKAGIIVDNYVAIGTDSPYAGYNIDSRGSHNFGNTSTEVYHYFQSSNVTGGSALSVYANNLSANSSRSHIMLADTAASVPTRFGLGVYTGASPYAYLDSASKLVINNASGANVIIGATTDAGYKLDVNGEIRGSMYRGANGAPLITFDAATNRVKIDNQGYGTTISNSLIVGDYLHVEAKATFNSYIRVKGNNSVISYAIGRPDATALDNASLAGMGVKFNTLWYTGAGLSFYVSEGADISGGFNIAEKLNLSPSGDLRVFNLAGTGNRMVVVDSSGVLSTQAIPSGNAGTVTSIATTGPITGGTITSSGTIGITQSSSSTDGYLSATDWMTFNSKQSALGYTAVPDARTITINGTSYDLSLNRSWSVGTITGTLTTGYVPKATGSSSLANSLIYDTGSAVLIGTTISSFNSYGLPLVVGSGSGNQGITVYSGSSAYGSLHFAYGVNTSESYNGGLEYSHSDNAMNILAGAIVRMIVKPNQVIITNNGSYSAGSERLHVSGSTVITGSLQLGSTITNGTYTYTLPGATGTLALTSQLSSFITLTSLSASSPLSYNNTTGAFSISQASGSTSGFLSSTDWTTFNNKQNALTNPVTGTGTTNYLPKFTGTSTIGNSAVFESGGNVGIGTATPSQLLHLETTLGSSSGVGTAIQITSGGAGGDQAWIGVNKGTGNGLEISVENRDIIFNTGAITPFGGTERMRLNASGNLGLGVTPSAWYSTVKAFQFSTTGSLWAVNGQQNTLLSTNDYIDSAATARYIANGYAMRYQQIDGAHSWQTAPSGTAGNAISFTQAMTLNASGNLSIGNTNDTYKLDVSGTGRFNGSGSNGYLYVSGNAGAGGSTNPAYLQGMNFSWNKSNGGGESLITYTGAGGGSNVRFGIGYWNNTTYAEQFSIASTGAATFSSSVTALSITGTNSVNTSGGMTIANDLTWTNNVGYGLKGQDGTRFLAFTTSGTVLDTSSIIQFLTSGSEKMRISNGGNVGIGTTSPTAALDVNGNGNTLVANFNYASNGTYVRWQNNGTSFGDIGSGSSLASGGSTNDFAIHARSTYNIIFATNFTERMRITSGGNVGIGYSAPDFTLSVFGTNVAQGDATITSHFVDKSSFAAGVGGGISFGGYFSSSSYANSFAYIQGIKENGTSGDYAGALKFGTRVNGGSVTERMRITSGGFVGIGVTPSAWSSATFPNVLQVGYASLITNGGAFTQLSSNLYYDGTVYKYISTNGASRIILDSDGAIIFNNAASGTGGTTVTTSERLRISNTGAATFSSSVTATQFNSTGGRGTSFGYKLPDWQIYNTTSGNALAFSNYSSDLLYITSGGNVGIGTTSPGSLLHMYSASGARLRMQSTASTFSLLDFYNDTTPRWSIGIDNTQAYGKLENRVLGTDAIRFYDSSNNLVLNPSSGNVGIGTTSPQRLLHILAPTGAHAYQRIEGGSGGYGGFLELMANSVGSGADSAGRLDFYMTSSNRIATIAAQRIDIGADYGTLVFSTANNSTTPSERMRITSTGNLYIGGTNLASDAKLGLSNANGEALEFAPAISSNTTRILSYNRGTSSYITSLQVASDFQWQTGTTERMRINSNGNVSIGNTNSTYKLDVSGSIRATSSLVFNNQASSGTFEWYGYSGNVYLYSNSVGNIVNINGTTGAYTAISDVNKKKDFELSNLGLDAVMGLKPTMYRMKSEYGTQKHLGFIAQEVKDYIPQAYVESGNFIGLSEMPLIAALTKAVQEQQAQIEELKSQLNK